MKSDKCPECRERENRHKASCGTLRKIREGKCRECRQANGHHKMDCSTGRAQSYVPVKDDWWGQCCGHSLTLTGEPNTSYVWKCSEGCHCTMQGCVPEYEY